MHISSLFLKYIILWRPLGYSLIFVGIIFEGDLSLITAAFLSRLDYLHPFDTFLIALTAIYTSDIFWYWIGRTVKTSNTRLANYIVALTRKIHINFDKNFFQKIFISKFAYGTHHLTLIKAAIEDVPFNKYVRNIFAASFLWVIIVGGLGYIFAASYLAVRRYFRFAEFGLLLALLVYYLIDKNISKQIEHKNLEK